MVKDGWKAIADLVGSLTPSEKGYFKKYSNGFSGSANQYLRLFQVIDSEKIITDVLVRSKLGQSKNIHGMRRFLYQQILKSLRAYHSEKNRPYQLREMLDYADILSEKGLHEQSLKFIHKGIMLSDPVTLPAYQILFQTEQIQMLRVFSEEEKMLKTDEIVSAITSSADIIRHAYITRRGLTKALFYVNTYFPLRNAAIKEEVFVLLDELLEVPDTTKQDYRVRNTRNAGIALLYRLLNNWDKAIEFQEKTIRLMQSMNTQHLNRNIPVISAYYNYISLILMRGDLHVFDRQIKIMMQLPVSGKAEERYHKAVVLQLQLDKIIFNKMFDDEAVVQEAELFLNEPHPIPGIYLDSLIRLASYYIFTKNFSAALEKINMLFDTNAKHALQSFPVHVRFMQILVHFELGNHLLLPSLIRHTYRFMMKQELKFEVEKLILNFFKRVLKHIDEKQLRREFTLLAKQLQEASSDQYEQQALKSFFDYRYWIAGKLN